MAASIIHRVSGAGLSIVGLAVLTWWLTALAGGAESYAEFAKVAGTPIGKIVLVGLTWAFFQHLLSGLRHFVMDSGAGFELKANKFWAVMTIIWAILLTAAVWAYIVFGRLA